MADVGKKISLHQTIIHQPLLKKTLKRAKSRFDFSPQERDRIEYISNPQSDDYRDWNRVRDWFVYNGLSDGIESHWTRDKNFGYAAKGPNETPKRSENYSDCLGVVVSGRHRETGEEISFMTHCAPQRLLNDAGFEEWLRDLCRNIGQTAAYGTVAAQVFGGRVGIPQSAYERLIENLGDVNSGEFPKKLKEYVPDEDIHAEIISLARSGNVQFLRPFFERMQENYARSLKLIQGVIQRELQLTPEVDEPLREDGTLDAYFDTPERNLFITRPERTKENTTDNIFKLQHSVRDKTQSTLEKNQ